MNVSVSLVVPTLNEADNVARLVEQVCASNVPLSEIVFVDDGSVDGTREQIRSLKAKYPIRLVERDRPALGLSGAIVEGARQATGEIVVMIDADLSHPPEKIGELLEPILAGEADMVIGSRYIPGGSTPGWPAWRRLMSRAGGLISYPLTKVHDSASGFFAIRRERLVDLASAASGFKLAFLTLLRAKGQLRVREVPIVFCDRTHGKSKMNYRVAVLFAAQWLRAVWDLARERSGRKSADGQSLNERPSATGRS